MSEQGGFVGQHCSYFLRSSSHLDDYVKSKLHGMEADLNHLIPKY